MNRPPHINRLSWVSVISVGMAFILMLVKRSLLLAHKYEYNGATELSTLIFVLIGFFTGCYSLIRTGFKGPKAVILRCVIGILLAVLFTIQMIIQVLILFEMADKLVS